MPIDLSGEGSIIISGSSTGTLQTKGSFTVGTQAVFFYTFSDINGTLFDPTDITSDIRDPDGTVIETISGGDKLSVGNFLIMWDISSSATTGKYTILVTYVADTIDGPETRTFSEDFLVLATGPGDIEFRRVATRSFLESRLGYLQRIPVFHEPARLNKAKTIAELSFPRWNQTAGTKVYVGGELKESGYTPDYNRGKITFDRPLSSYDQLLVSYNFRWFTDDELDGFIEQGVNVYNIYTPQTNSTINNIPDQWLIPSAYAAIVDAIRRFMMDINFQEPAKIFGGLKRAQEVFGNLDSLKKNYEEMLFKLLEQKKLGPYPSIRTITSPSMTLPGGRSRWFRLLFSSGI